MSSSTTAAQMGTTGVPAPGLEKKPVKFSNLLLGAGLNMFEYVITTAQSMHEGKTGQSC